MKSVSLAEIIESISPFVPISEIWQNAVEQYEKQPSPEALVRPVVFDLISTYRHSGVAAELADYLRKTVADVRPPWRNTKTAKVAEAPDAEVLSLLDEISLQYSRLQKAQDLRRADWHDQHAQDRERWGRDNHFLLADTLVVDRRAMIGFLDHYGIPHNLDGRSSDTTKRSNVERLRESLGPVDDNAFESLYEVLRAVAPHIPVDVQDARNYSSNLGTAYSFGAEPGLDLTGQPEEIERQTVFSAPVSRLFQESRAAEQLLSLFGSGKASDLPKWREQRSGKSLALPGLEQEGMRELVRLSELEAQYKTEYDRHRLYSMRFDTKPKTEELSLETSVLDLRKRSRMHEIGFIRREIIPFLDDHEIKHNLGRVGGPSTADKFRAEPVKRWLTTAELANVFADIESCALKTGRDRKGWMRYLQGKRAKWARQAPVLAKEGGKGRGNSAYWDPVEFAKMATQEGRPPINPKVFDERFATAKLLEPWKGDWDAWRLSEVDLASENPAKKPGKSGPRLRRELSNSLFPKEK